MNPCPHCGAEMRALFTTVYCPRDCWDRTEELHAAYETVRGEFPMDGHPGASRVSLDVSRPAPALFVWTTDCVIFCPIARFHPADLDLVDHLRREVVLLLNREAN